MVSLIRYAGRETMTTYRDIADDIAAAIYAGHYQPGAKLPSQPDLIGRYGVSESTLRSAMRELRARRLVVDRPGKGLHVTDSLPPA